MEQLRLLLTGGKQTIVAPACDVMEAMQKNGLAVDSDQAIYKFFRSLTEKQMETGSLRLMVFMTIAGDVTYMPCVDGSWRFSAQMKALDCGYLRSVLRTVSPAMWKRYANSGALPPATRTT